MTPLQNVLPLRMSKIPDIRERAKYFYHVDSRDDGECLSNITAAHSNSTPLGKKMEERKSRWS